VAGDGKRVSAPKNDKVGNGKRGVNIHSKAEPDCQIHQGP